MHSLRPSLAALLIALAAGCATTSAPPAPQSPAEMAALTVLRTSTDVHEKARACQDLATFASAASVPDLAALLNDEHLGDYARSGLESIPDASAGRALRRALPKLEGRSLAGVVNSLGVRREYAAVGDLKALAYDTKRGADSEAVAALGQIASPDAAKVLEQMLAHGPARLRIPAAHAALVAADRILKDGNPETARRLLDAVVMARPSDSLVRVAQSQMR